MRIAFSCDDDRGLDAIMAYHFGRCPYFVLVDVDGNEIARVQSIPNPYYGRHAPGVVPKFIHDQGAEVMITGGMGSRAVAFFEQFGVQVVTGGAGSVRQVLERYLHGELSGAEPCGQSKSQAERDGEQGYEERTPVERLREEIAALRRQLADAERRLEELS